MRASCTDLCALTVRKWGPLSHLLQNATIFSGLQGFISDFSGRITVVIWLLFHCAHIWRNCTFGNIFFHVSPLADLNENQLMWKACNLKMTSFPINLSLTFASQQYSVWIVYSQSHSPEKTQGMGVQFRPTYTTVSMCACVHTVCVSIMSW